MTTVKAEIDDATDRELNILKVERECTKAEAVALALDEWAAERGGGDE